jgi:hypothetical protein
MAGNRLILLFLSLLAVLPLPANLAKVNVVKGREQTAVIEPADDNKSREAKSRKFLTIFKLLVGAKRAP